MFYKLGILNKEVYYDANGKIFKTNKNWQLNNKINYICNPNVTSC
jgi:hypothetical protein